MNCFGGGSYGPCWPGCGPCGPCGPSYASPYSQPPCAQPSCPRQPSPQYCQAPCNYGGYRQPAPCSQPCQQPCQPPQQSCGMAYGTYHSYGRPGMSRGPCQPQQQSSPQPAPVCYEAPLY